MSRLVVVSNRVADPRKTAAGGLAVALGEALAESGGLWFGTSGTVVERSQGEGKLHTHRAGNVTQAPLTDLMQPPRLVDPDHRWVNLAQALGIFI